MKSFRLEHYDFVLIDGLHTNEQIVMDYEAIRAHVHDGSIIYCHDIGAYQMERGFADVARQAKAMDFESAELRFTHVGSRVLVGSHCKAVLDWVRLVNPIESSRFTKSQPYGLGFEGTRVLALVALSIKGTARSLMNRLRRS